MDKSKFSCKAFAVRLLAIALWIDAATPAMAQQSGKISYPALGIEFEVPDGWIGQESADGFLIGSNTEPGMIVLSTHEHKDLAALKQEAEQGIAEEGGNVLRKSTDFVAIGDNATAAEFSGTVEGQDAKAYIAGVINPHGAGVTVMALTTTDAYGPRYSQLVTEIVESLRFAKPVESSAVTEWRQALAGAKLTYLESYRSSGPSVDGFATGGGYSTQIVIRLCGDGTFTDSSNSSMSIDTGGAFGSSSGRDQGAGQWSVIGNVQGGATLKLDYPNGDVAQYALDYRDQKTYLNGTRYFRTQDAGC